MVLYVNDEKIDPKQIEAEVEKLRPHYERIFAEQDAQDREKQLLEWSRENVIESVLFRQAAWSDSNVINAEQVENAYQQLLEEAGGKDKFYERAGLGQNSESQVKKDTEEHLRIEQLVEKITSKASEPTDKQIKIHYEKNIEKYTIPQRVRASHIVKHITPDSDPESLYQEMKTILECIKSGADFAAVASSSSDCPENGGDLGFFPRGQMVQEFEDAVFALEPGQVSDVFQTGFGFHIAKVTDKTLSVPCPLEDVRQIIVGELIELAGQKELEKFIDAEKDKAKIEDKD